jgi:hypothetical protein
LQRFVRHSPLLSTNVVAVLPSSASLRKTLQLASVIVMFALRNGVAQLDESVGWTTTYALFNRVLFLNITQQRDEAHDHVFCNSR